MKTAIQLAIEHYENLSLQGSNQAYIVAKYLKENFLLIETEQILALKKENEALKAEIKVLREKSYSQNKFSEKHVNELVKQIEFGVAKQK